MKFDVEGIKNLTFPSGAMGYKKQDVDDFLTYVAKDYGSFQRQLEQSREETKQAEATLTKLQLDFDTYKKKDAASIAQVEKENQALKQQLMEQQLAPASSALNEGQALSLAQKIALRIEKQAQEDAQKILEEANRYYEEQSQRLEQKKQAVHSEVLASLSDLLGSERMVIASVDVVKQEYSRLMSVIRENYEGMMSEKTT